MRLSDVCRVTSLVFAAVLLGSCVVALGIEQIFFGYDEGEPLMTDNIRGSTVDRIGTDWWSSEEPKFNVEDGQQLPYAYHDAWFDVWLADGTLTPVACAQRWRSIITGQGDPKFPGRNVGNPSVIVLDEIGTTFSDADATTGGKKGGLLRAALDEYFQLSGNRSHIIGLMSPGLSQQLAAASNYNDIIYCTNSRLRWMGLELYCKYSEFRNGRENKTGDDYLARFLTQPMRNWITTNGMFRDRVRPVLKVSNDADGTTRADYHKFLNRQFWFMANGWYNGARTAVDGNVKVCMQGGVGAYKFEPGTLADQLVDTITARDSHHEQFIYWYCDQLNTAPHAYGLAPLP
jgi:hypothetical protein